MKILIIGTAAEGKSTIARLLDTVLKKNRIYDVTINDELDDEEAHLNWKLRSWHQKKRLEKLSSNKLKIEIETCQPKIESFYNEKKKT